MPNATNIAIMPVEGDLDVTTVDGVRAQIERLRAAGCRRIILNLAKTAYIDSCGMALIASESRKMRDVGGLISLLNVCEAVRKTLVLTRLLDFVPVSRAQGETDIPMLSPDAQPLWQRTLGVSPKGLGLARKRVNELLRETTLGPDDVFDMTLAAGEAMGNAVDHTAGEGIVVTVSRYTDRVIMEVSDNGEGFVPPPDCADHAGECLERGRGIRLMQLLADDVAFLSKVSGPGTVVRIVKLFGPRRA